MRRSHRQLIYIFVLFRLIFNRFKVLKTHKPHIKHCMVKIEIESNAGDKETKNSVTLVKPTFIWWLSS